MSGSAVQTVRLLFVDEGSFREEDVEIEDELLERHERLIDVLQEEPSVLGRLHVDLDRLCSARIVSSDGT